MKLIIQDNNGEQMVSIRYTPKQGLAGDLECAIRDHIERGHGRGFEAASMFSVAYADVYHAMARENHVKRMLQKQN